MNLFTLFFSHILEIFNYDEEHSYLLFKIYKNGELHVLGFDHHTDFNSWENLDMVMMHLTMYCQIQTANIFF